MKKITGTCLESELIPSEGEGYALTVELTSAGDEEVPISGVFLSRKGINALPEFADGFGFDPSDVIEGLAPERYQFRVQMLLSHKGSLIYGDGKSELRLSPSKKIRFRLPLPFEWIHFFLDSPAEDLFIAVSCLSGEDRIVDIADLQSTMHQTVELHGHDGYKFNTEVSIIVPQKSPPDDRIMNLVGKTNKKPIRRMPNT